MRIASLMSVSGIVSALVFGCSDEAADTPPADTGVDTGGDTGVVTADTTPVDTGSTLVDTGMPETIDPLDGLTEAEWKTIKTLGPLPAVPKDPTNAHADDAKAALLGQMLFFDKSYSGAIAVADDGMSGALGTTGDTGKVSCASCHEGVTMDDNRSKPNNVSLGTDFGTRNSLSIANSSFYAWTNWGGRFDSQWSLPLAVAENAKIMNSSRLAVGRLLWTKYRTEYDAIFPAKLDARFDAAHATPFGTGKAAYDALGVTEKDIVDRMYSNFGKAIAAYMRLVVSREAPFDRYVAGDFAALNPAAKRGLRVFIGKGACVSCHSGPNFADDKFHALAVPQTGPKVPAADLGRFADVPPLLTSVFKTDGVYSDDKTTGKLTGLMSDPAQKGQFRTKSLRGVSESGPYMHSGQFATLEEVVAYYGKGGDTPPADITKDPLMKAFPLEGTDTADLVAFMKTLHGAAVPSDLRKNTAK